MLESVRHFRLLKLRTVRNNKSIAVRRMEFDDLAAQSSAQREWEEGQWEGKRWGGGGGGQDMGGGGDGGGGNMTNTHLEDALQQMTIARNHLIMVLVRPRSCVFTVCTLWPSFSTIFVATVGRLPIK